MTQIDLGRETSGILIEVRTVLSRARTALYGEGHDPTWMSRARFITEPGYWEWDAEGRSHFVGEESVPHPDAADMQAAMEKVVELLSPWERTGRPIKKKP